MRKNVVVFSLVTLVTVATAYSGLWLFTAYKLKQNVESFTQNFNQSDEHNQIAYASINYAGFPFKPGIDINAPQLKLAINDSSVEIIATDKLTLQTNFFGNEYEIISQGDILTNLHLPNKEYKLVNRSDKNATASVKFNYGINLFSKLSMTETLNSLSEIGICTYGSKTMDAGTGNVFAESKELHFKIGLEKIEQNQYKVDLFFHHVDFEGLKELDNLLQDLIMLAPEAPPQNFSFFHRNGKMNTKIHLTYKGALSTDPFLNKNFDCAVTVHEISYRDNNSRGKSDGLFELGMSGDDIHAVIRYDSKEDFSESWQANSVLSIKESLNSYATASSATDDNKLSSIENETLKKLEEAIENLMPQMHQFGKISYGIDCSVDAQINNYIKVNLEKADFLCKLYGTKLKSNFELISSTPKLNLDIHLINYDPLLTDLGNYINKVLHTIHKIEPTFAYTPDEQWVQAIKAFLVKISDTPEGASDLKLTITQNENSLPSIGNYNFIEVTSLFNDMVEPYLGTTNTE